MPIVWCSPERGNNAGHQPEVFVFTDLAELRQCTGNSSLCKVTVKPIVIHLIANREERIFAAPLNCIISEATLQDCFSSKNFHHVPAHTNVDHCVTRLIGTEKYPARTTHFDSLLDERKGV